MTPSARPQRTALSVMLAVWHALLLREALSRLFHRRGAWVWLLLEPVAHMGFMVIVFTVVRVRTISNIDTVVWLVLGFLGFFLFRRTATQCGNAVGANHALFAYRQVKPVDTVFVRAMVEGLLMLGVATVILTALRLGAHDVLPARPLKTMEAALGLWWLGLGLGLIVSAAKGLTEELGNLADLLMTPLYLVSGVILPLSAVHQPYRQWLFYNPVAHGLEALRQGFSDLYHAPPELNLDYLHAWALALVFLGLALHVRFQPQLTAK